MKIKDKLKLLRDSEDRNRRRIKATTAKPAKCPVIGRSENTIGNSTKQRDKL